MTTLRIPKRSINAAANGAVKPKSKTFTDIANEISSLPHPKESSRGIIKTDGADLKPDVAINVKKVMIAAIQAG
jgi:hypothetical protein